MKQLFQVTNKLGIEWWYLLVAIIFGVVMVFAMPPFQVMDEYRHFIKSYAVSQGQLLCSTTDEGKSGMYIPENVRYAGEIMGVTELPYWPDRKIIDEEIERADQVSAQDSKPTFFQHPFCESPVWSTLPQALGIFIANLFGLSLLGVFYAGRLSNLLVAVGLIFCAIRKIPYGKYILAFVALLPMFVHQLASYSLDALHYALLFYFIASVIRLARYEKVYHWKQLFYLAVLGGVAIYAKIGFFPFMLLLILLPQEKFSKRSTYWWYVLGTFTAYILCFFVIRLIFSAEGTNVNMGGVDRFGQLYFVATNPLEFAEILMRSIEIHFNFYWNNLLGILGWLDHRLFNLHYLLLLVGGYVITLVSTEEELPTVKERVIFGLIALVNALLLFIILYAIDDDVGAPLISLMQGKYLLPLLPLLLFSVLGLHLSIKVKQILVIGISIASIALTSMVISQRYYTHDTVPVVQYNADEKYRRDGAIAGNALTQYIVATRDNLDGVALWIDGFRDVPDGAVNVILRDAECKEIVRSAYIREGDIYSKGYHTVFFDPIIDSSSKTYCLEVFNILPQGRTPLPLLTTLEDSYQDGYAKIGTQQLKGDLVMKLIYRK